MTTAPPETRDMPPGIVLDEERDVAGNLIASAVFDTTDDYRYLLTRIWDPTLPLACWVALNPSTATAAKNDATLTRIVDFTARFGCGGLAIVNLFAVRSRHPQILTRHAEPVGEYNDLFIRNAAQSTRGGPVIAAWGTWGHHKRLRDRATHVTRLLNDCGAQLRSLGTTADSSGRQPLHPLMLHKHTEHQPYP